jgi:hypothetical protein
MINFIHHSVTKKSKNKDEERRKRNYVKRIQERKKNKNKKIKKREICVDFFE